MERRCPDHPHVTLYYGLACPVPGTDHRRYCSVCNGSDRPFVDIFAPVQQRYNESESPKDIVLKESDKILVTKQDNRDQNGIGNVFTKEGKTFVRFSNGDEGEVTLLSKDELLCLNIKDYLTLKKSSYLK